MIARRTKAPAHRPVGAARAQQRGPAAAPVLRGPQRERHEPDWVLLLSVVALAALGILMVYSSTGVYALLDKDPFAVVGPQAIWGVLGAVADGRDHARRLPLPAARVGGRNSSSRWFC